MLLEIMAGGSTFILLPRRLALADCYSLSPLLETGGLLLWPCELPTLEFEDSMVSWGLPGVVRCLVRFGDIRPVGPLVSF